MGYNNDDSYYWELYVKRQSDISLKGSSDIVLNEADRVVIFDPEMSDDYVVNATGNPLTRVSKNAKEWKGFSGRYNRRDYAIKKSLERQLKDIKNKKK